MKVVSLLSGKSKKVHDFPDNYVNNYESSIWIDNYVNIKKSPISFLYTSNNHAENKMKTYPFTATATTNA